MMTMLGKNANPTAQGSANGGNTLLHVAAEHNSLGVLSNYVALVRSGQASRVVNNDACLDVECVPIMIGLV